MTTDKLSLEEVEQFAQPDNYSLVCQLAEKFAAAMRENEKLKEYLAFETSEKEAWQKRAWELVGQPCKHSETVRPPQNEWAGNSFMNFAGDGSSISSKHKEVCKYCGRTEHGMPCHLNLSDQ